jgi:hypothetical protein
MRDRDTRVVARLKCAGEQVVREFGDLGAVAATIFTLEVELGRFERRNEFIKPLWIRTLEIINPLLRIAERDNMAVLAQLFDHRP